MNKKKKKLIIIIIFIIIILSASIFVFTEKNKENKKIRQLNDTEENEIGNITEEKSKEESTEENVLNENVLEEDKEKDKTKELKGLEQEKQGKKILIEQEKNVNNTSKTEENNVKKTNVNSKQENNKNINQKQENKEQNLPAYTEQKVEIAEKKECKNGKHSIEAGNSGKWFNSQTEAIAEYNTITKKWGNKWENFEIDDETYYKNCPYGYEVWTCPVCKKWSINYYYHNK